MNHDECQSYLSHLHSEHHRLELLSKNVAERFRSASDESWNRVDRPEIAARLSALRDELTRHIEEEDHGGCVDEAIARMPSLSQAAKQIYQENEELEVRLHNVFRIVEYGTRVEAQQAFCGFAADLRLHEQHEEEIVEKGLNRYPYNH